MTDEARLDVWICQFWITYQILLCDIRVFYFTSHYKIQSSTSVAVPCKHREGKRDANRMENVRYTSVTPLVFQADDGMGCYCREALKALDESFPSKRIMNATQ